MNFNRTIRISFEFHDLFEFESNSGLYYPNRIRTKDNSIRMIRLGALSKNNKNKKENNKHKNECIENLRRNKRLQY